MKIIAFSGGYGVGKSTAIEALKECYPTTPVYLVKFAQPLYDMQEFIYNRIESVYTRPFDFKKDRKLLQWIGTEWGRDSVSQTLWVDLWKTAVDEIQAFHGPCIIVCDDCRFDNEAQTIKDLGGKIIKIVRPDSAAHAQGGTGIAGHKSESGVSEIFLDSTVYNDDTLATYRERLLACFRELNKPEL